MLCTFLEFKTNLWIGSVGNFWIDQNSSYSQVSLNNNLLVTNEWGRPAIYVFALRHKYQIELFVSWHVDHDAYATDWMCLSWKGKYVYIFPPFSMLSKVVERLQKDQTRALVIAPLWRTQDWFPKMSQMLISQPVLLQKEESLLQVNTRHDQSVPSMAQTSTDGMLLVRERLRHQKISAQACNVIMELWRTGTSKLYRMSLDKWRNFARTKNENPIHSTVAKVTVLSFWHTCMTLEAAIQPLALPDLHYLQQHA